MVQNRLEDIEEEGSEMQLKDAVRTCLERESGEAGIHEALSMLCSALPVDRVSLHALDESRASFRVVGGGGGVVLAPGTECPVESSTQVSIPASGQLFCRRNFSDGPFDAALDHLIADIGYRSGVSVPLFMGSQPTGVVVASSFGADLDCEAVVGAVNDVSASLTMACHGARASGSTRVLICHGDALIAEGIARIVENTLGDADVSIRLTPAAAIEEADSGVGLPDLVVCDSFVGGQRIDRFLPDLRSAGAIASTLVIASRDSPLSRKVAVRSGAAGYVASSEGPSGIARALRHVATGETSGFDGLSDLIDDGSQPVAQLTEQEFRLLVNLERGLRFKQIALAMNISESTAKGYAQNLFGKLDVHSRSEAVYEARRQGLLDATARQVGRDAAAVSAAS